MRDDRFSYELFNLFLAGVSSIGGAFKSLMDLRQGLLPWTYFGVVKSKEYTATSLASFLEITASFGKYFDKLLRQFS